MISPSSGQKHGRCGHRWKTLKLSEDGYELVAHVCTSAKYHPDDHASEDGSRRPVKEAQSRWTIKEASMTYMLVKVP
jgi:hypothetical protein